jgi:hypothetical protein
VHADPATVADGQPGGLLTTVLQGEQPEERQLGDAIAIGCRQPEDAALLLWNVIGEGRDGEFTSH